jgi:hypothetical protein
MWPCALPAERLALNRGRVFKPPPPNQCPAGALRLELENTPTRARPSALRLHSAASFEARAGHAPAAQPALLALAGKQASGIAGSGLSERAARRLVQRWVLAPHTDPSVCPHSCCPQCMAPLPPRWCGRRRCLAPQRRRRAPPVNAPPSSKDHALGSTPLRTTAYARRRYGSLEAILAAWDRGELASLGPAGAAALGPGLGRDVACRNLRLLALAAGAQALPEGVVGDLLAVLEGGGGGGGGSGGGGGDGGGGGGGGGGGAGSGCSSSSSSSSSSSKSSGIRDTSSSGLGGSSLDKARRQGQKQQEQEGAVAAPAPPGAGRGAEGKAQGADLLEAPGTATVLDLVSLHPSIGGRWAQWAPQLAAATAAARRLGLPAAGPWVCPANGLPMDLVVRVYDDAGALLPALRPAGGGSDSSGGGSSGGASTSSGDCSNGGGGGGGAFAKQDCVAVQVVTPWDLAVPLGGAKAGGRSTRLQLSPGAKRRASLLKACGWRTAQLQWPCGVGDGSSGGGECRADGSSAEGEVSALVATLLAALGLGTG